MKKLRFVIMSLILIFANIFSVSAQNSDSQVRTGLSAICEGTTTKSLASGGSVKFYGTAIKYYGSSTWEYNVEYRKLSGTFDKIEIETSSYFSSFENEKFDFAFSIYYFDDNDDYNVYTDRTQITLACRMEVL